MFIEFNQASRRVRVLGLYWKDWNRNDLVYGIVVPVLVVLLIVVISKLPSLFEGGFGVITGIVMQIEELVVIAGVPWFLVWYGIDGLEALQVSFWEASTLCTGQIFIVECRALEQF